MSRATCNPCQRFRHSREANETRLLPDRGSGKSRAACPAIGCGAAQSLRPRVDVTWRSRALVKSHARQNSDFARTDCSRSRQSLPACIAMTQHREDCARKCAKISLFFRVHAQSNTVRVERNVRCAPFTHATSMWADRMHMRSSPRHAGKRPDLRGLFRLVGTGSNSPGVGQRCALRSSPYRESVLTMPSLYSGPWRNDMAVGIILRCGKCARDKQVEDHSARGLLILDVSTSPFRWGLQHRAGWRNGGHVEPERRS